jgi:hypothetical protein
VRAKRKAEYRKPADKRYKTRYRRRYVVRFGREATTCTGMILNLSATGVFLASTSIFRPGNQILLDFRVEGIPYTLEGVVRWARQAPPSLVRQIPSGMGVEIIAPPDAYVKLVSTLKSVAPESQTR